MMSGPKKGVALAGKVSAPKEGAAEATDSTPDLFAMKKISMEKVEQRVIDHMD